MCQKNSNSTIVINKSPMDLKSRCQKVIPTYLRVRMGRRSFASRTWSAINDSSSLAKKRNSKISMENSWKAHCPNDNRMICDWSLLKWHTSEQQHMEQSSLDLHHRMDDSSDALSTINQCHSNEIKESTKNTHSTNLMTMLTKMIGVGDQKSQSQNIKHKFSHLHRTHKRTHSTSKSFAHLHTHAVSTILSRTAIYFFRSSDKHFKI